MSEINAEVIEGIPQGQTLAPDEEQAPADGYRDAEEPAQTVNIFEQERGGVAWCDVYGIASDANGIKHLCNKISLTERGENSEKALRGLMKTLKIAKDEFHLTPWIPDQPSTARRPALTAAPATAAEPPAKIKTTRAVTDEEGEPDYEDEPVPSKKVQPAKTGGGRMKIIKLKLSPRDDEKVTVDLFAAGREFADLHMVKSPDDLADMFGDNFEPEINWEPAKPKTYNVELWATWELSERLNSKGNPYKNVTEIMPA